MNTIDHSQFCELCAALDACTDDMPETRRYDTRRALAEQILADARVPKAERYMGRHRFIDLGALPAAALPRALTTLQRLAALPA